MATAFLRQHAARGSLTFSSEAEVNKRSWPRSNQEVCHFLFPLCEQAAAEAKYAGQVDDLHHDVL